jgi:ribosome production factor 1
MDEFSAYFREQVTPKILMTTGGQVHKATYDFMKEIREVFPNCHYWPRRGYSLKEICEEAPKREYTHLMVWREHRRSVSELILTYLPSGPTAVFKVTTTKLNSDIYHHGNPTDHYPEMILNNFNTRVGRRVARLLASLCPQRPEFKGRRAVTFHN